MRRRHLLALGPVTALALAGRPIGAEADPDSDTVMGAIALATLEQESGGRLGVFARADGSDRILSWRADTAFPMGSTFKAPLAALALSRVQDGSDTLHTELRFGPADLIAASPVTAAHLSVGRLPIADLVSAILEQSDNTAANLLLAHVGGPAALTAFLRAIGDRDTIIRRGEVIGATPDTDNTTTARAFAATLHTLCLGDVLRPELRNLLLQGMRNNRPGRTRLRSAFPADWQTADRTGTADGVCNDGAIAWPPHKPPVAAAVFHDAPGITLAAQEAVLRVVGHKVAERFG